jgi:hypothetical protein
VILNEFEARALIKLWGERIAEMAATATYADVRVYGDKMHELANVLDPDFREPPHTIIRKSL